MNHIDPNGMYYGDFFDFNGKYIGNDGIDDGKIYVMKTTKTGTSESGANYLGIDRTSRKEAIKYINLYSGNTNYFEENSIYDNFVEIENDPIIREQIYSIIRKDNGYGGTKPSNNREYGGVIRNGKVVESPAGPVGDPSTDSDIHINIQTLPGDIMFHTHPSGTVNTMSVSNNVLNTTTNNDKWIQPPSIDDLIKAQDYTFYYVFGMYEKKVYLYNKNGIISIFPHKLFINPHNKK